MHGQRLRAAQRRALRDRFIALAGNALDDCLRSSHLGSQRSISDQGFKLPTGVSENIVKLRYSF